MKAVIHIEINSCQECPYFETINEGNPLVDDKVSYYCNKLDNDIYFPQNIHSRCPYRDLS